MQISDRYNVIWIKKTDSTSDCLKRQMDTLENRSVIAALEQTAGRGQADHRWHSAAGENLTFSILLKYTSPEFKAADQQLLTMSSSLTVIDFLSEFGISATIKKPNDIYVGDRKICGMLIENGLKGSIMDWSIVGMGIDINQSVFPADIPNPTSMKLLTGRDYDIKKCLSILLKHFFSRFDAIWAEPEALKKEYSLKLLSLRQ